MAVTFKMKLPLRVRLLPPRGANESSVTIKDADGYHVAEVCFGVQPEDGERAAAEFVEAVNSFPAYQNLQKAASAVAVVYADMQDGNGDPCPEIAALKAALGGDGPEYVLASSLAALAARVAELEAALKPFADMADSWSESEPDDTMMDYHEEDGAHINLGHCRAARATLSNVEAVSHG